MRAGGDARVPVLDLSRHRRVWLLSVAGRDAIPATDEPLCHGIGLPYPRPFSAAFVHEGELWLQVGRRRWDVRTIREVRQVKETARLAEYAIAMNDGSLEHVTIRFPGTVAAMRVIDPTHDEIDSWSEDIMKVLPYTAADGWSAGEPDVAAWAARVTPMWGSGLRSDGTENG